MERIIFFFLLPFFTLGQTLQPTIHLGIEDGISQNTVWAIEEDFSNRMWFGSPGGIRIYDGFELQNGPQIDDIVLTLQKHDSSMYCITNGGIYKINPQNLHFKKVDFPIPGYYQSQFEESGITLYSGNGEILGVYNYNLEKTSGKAQNNSKFKASKFKFILDGISFTIGPSGIFKGNKELLANNFCNGYVKYQDNMAFVATHSGIVKLTVDNGTIALHRYFEDWRMEKMFIDHNKNLWVGTSDYGVFLIHKNAIHSSYFKKSTPLNQPISCWSIFPIDDELHVATTHGIIPVETHNWQNNSIYKLTKHLACNTGIDGGDFVLIGTRKNGIYKLQNGYLKQVYYNPQNALDNVIIQIHKSNNGFLAASKGSFIQLDKTGNFLGPKFSKQHQEGGYVMEFTPTSKGYVAAKTNGVIEINHQIEVVKKYHHSRINITSMVRPFQNQWWGVAMDEGLFKLNNDSIVMLPFMDKHLFTLCAVNDTTLWISGVNHIYQYTQNITRQYSLQNGFPLKEYNQNSHYKSSNGYLYYSGVTGVFKFHPDHVKELPEMPFTRVIHNGKWLDTNQVISLNFDQSELHLNINPVLITDQNLFSIQVKHDSHWVDVSSPTAFDFKVNYGSSEIKIKTTNLVSQKSNIATYAIYRSSPFWHQSWFYVFVGLTFVLLVIGGYSFWGFIKTKRQLAKEKTNRKINEERLRISQELHDNIGARLTHIISSLDIELYKSKSSTIENVNAFARDTMSQLRETIWAVSNKTIFFSEFITRVEQYTEQVNQLTAQKIDFTSAKIPDFELNPIQTINYYRIVQEAINNAVKYAHADEINVAVYKEHNQISIKINDNGQGFDTANTRFGTGIKGMKSRAKEVGGILTISSETNTGTTVLLQLKPK